MKNGKRCTAIVLAAGSGKRMHSSVAKQYMLLGQKPIIWYALNAMEQSEVIDDCILVAAQEDLEYARTDIVQKYGFSKVDTVVAGGEERFLSVMNALHAVEAGGLHIPNTDGYLFIHDGARPFLTEEMIGKLADAVESCHACVAAMPVKDTIKIADDKGYALQTPDRRAVWSVQTPQVFDTRLVLEAYERLGGRLQRMREQGISVTDDAGVVELFTDAKVKMVETSYKNIKITTPEDLVIAESLMSIP